VRDFFGTPWNELAAGHVETFLADAGDEGLTWEAKGREEPHRDSVRKAVCGMANSSGGFLIVGAERGAGRVWTLRGVQFRSDEPGTWLSSLITSGLNPVPPFDVKVFDRDTGRKAAIIGVEPVIVPPCITASGAVYQRASGQTLPVVDQRVLAELYGRGRAVREQAQTLALRASERALQEPRRNRTRSPCSASRCARHKARRTRPRCCSRRAS
jgi:Schlafen, AlbA_2